VERVSDLLDKTPRRVSVEFAEPVDLAGLRELPGVSDLTAGDGRVSFKVAGDIDPVLKAIARHPVVDLQFARPTLEEVFLTYYEGGQG
jgi:ABC-2 type transport system ATP-binding protein